MTKTSGVVTFLDASAVKLQGRDACIIPRGVSAAVNQNCRNANAEKNIGQVNDPRGKREEIVTRKISVGFC